MVLTAFGLVRAPQARDPARAMPKSKTLTAGSTQPGLDRTGAGAMQGQATRNEAGGGDLSRGEIGSGEDGPEGAAHRGRLRVRALVTLRWLVVAGEVLLLLLVMGMRFSIPYPMCFAVVGAGAWVNLLTGVASPGQRLFGDREA